MKKLLIAGLLIIGISTFAQNRNNDVNNNVKDHPKKEQSSDDQELKHLTSELKLSQKQQQKIKKLLEERNTRQKDEKISGTKRKPENEKEDLKKAPKDRNEFDTKLKKILTKEQYKKWEAQRKSENPEKGDKPKPKQKQFQ